MSTDALSSDKHLSPFEQLRYAREIIQLESQALTKVAGRLDGEFCRAVELIARCKGSVVVSGMGKAGLIGQKISATLSSTGTRSNWLHPGEAFHGDLGRFRADDVALVLSQSGETEEVVRMLGPLADFGVPLVAMTCQPQSALGRAATVVLDLGPLKEACPLGLAPSTTTAAMLAMGDALALVASRMRGFRAEDFARFHPGGSLGRKLSKVEDYMRPLEECRLAGAEWTVREVFVRCTKPGRRTGAIMILDADERLAGVFTDSDLARLFERRNESALDGPIAGVMTKNPTTVPGGSMMRDALEIMAERKISELPVVAADARPAGLLDVTDVVGLFPEEAAAVTSSIAMPDRVPPPKVLKIAKERSAVSG